MMNRFVTAVVGGFLIFALGRASGATAQDWREEASLPQPLSSMVAVASDGDIYVVGGRNGRGAVSNALLRYDVTAERWFEDLAAMENARYFAAAAVLDGKIYVIGGRDQDDEVLESVEVFDPRTGAWSEAAELEEERYGHTAVVLDGRLYVLGGADDDGDVLKSVEVYDAEEDEWEISDRWELDQPRAAFATVAIRRAAYSFGGVNRVPIPQVQRFATEDGPGVILPPGLLRARAYVGAVAVGDSVYVIGGRSDRDRALDDVVLFVPYDVPGRQWQSAQRLREARDSFGAVEVNGTLYVIGGRGGDERALSSVESLDARTMVGTERPDDVDFTLEQNHPNPFASSTRIAFSLGTASERVELSVYDLQGRLVHRLLDGYVPAGRHEVEWDGSAAGRVMPSGVYVYVLRQGGAQRTKMMTRIR